MHHPENTGLPCVVNDRYLRFNGTPEGLIKVALKTGAVVGDVVWADHAQGEGYEQYLLTDAGDGSVTLSRPEE